MFIFLLFIGYRALAKTHLNNFNFTSTYPQNLGGPISAS